MGKIFFVVLFGALPGLSLGGVVLQEASGPAVCRGMALVPGGKYFMGAPAKTGGSDEHPRHKVFLDGFFIDKCEVTVAQYKAFSKAAGQVMPSQPAWSGDAYPVVGVDWFEARDYCAWAGKRLPTEAEWEKAARGGTSYEYGFGDDRSKLGEYAWYSDNSGNQAHPAGLKKPNGFGLYDMHGNAAEWIGDWYDAGYYGLSPVVDPRGPDSGLVRVIRGGSWSYYAYYFARNLRVSDRFWDYPAERNMDVGLRCARSGASSGK